VGEELGQVDAAPPGQLRGLRAAGEAVREQQRAGAARSAGSSSFSATATDTS
jgi:hypothetical protein